MGLQVDRIWCAFWSMGDADRTSFRSLIDVLPAYCLGVTAFGRSGSVLHGARPCITARVFQSPTLFIAVCEVRSMFCPNAL